MADPATNMWDWLIGLGTAAGPLFGAWLGFHYQAKQAAKVTTRQRIEKLADEAAQRDREEAKQRIGRAYARSLLARHLEAYARKCADAMWENTNPEHDKIVAVPALPDWPDISWELLGADEMMRIRDIGVHVEMYKEVVDGNLYWGTSGRDDERRYRADGAAIIGNEAWNIAVRIRDEAGISAFVVPHGTGNFADGLAEHVHDRDEERRQAQERRDADPNEIL